MRVQHQLGTNALSPLTNLTGHLKEDTVQQEAIDLALVHVNGLLQKQKLNVLKSNIDLIL